MTARYYSIALILIAAGLAWCHSASAQPAPGDVFREYMWWNEEGDAGGALRVGGKFGQEHVDRGWAHDYINAPVTLDHALDLDHAVKAEVVIEKILCHDGTKGLAIQINGNEWLEVPEAKRIPRPPWEYQHHVYPVLPFPLEWLKPGEGNEFRMRVNPEHTWRWPQNLIYGVHFRVYYDPDKKLHPQGKIVSPVPDESIGMSVKLECQATSPNGKITRVDYLGHYEDVNFEGDGEYRQWHYRFFHGDILNHLGSVAKSPYRITWDTSWVPDQDGPMRLAARIVDETNVIYMSEAVNGLKLVRPGFSVELCKPYNVPKRWVTRRGNKEENFDIVGDLSKASAAQLVWASWSPGYMNGIYVNGHKVFHNEGPKYRYYAHRVTVDQVSAFRPGVNTLATGASEKGHHGMEVNWPGIMVLIQYALDE